MSLFATTLLWKECFWHVQFSLSRWLTRSWGMARKGTHSYSFCPAEWQRQVKYPSINLTWCSSSCWLSISQEAKPAQPQGRSDIRLLTSLRAAPWCSCSTWNLNYEVDFRIVVKCWKHNISTCFCQMTNSYYWCCICQEVKDAKTANGKV